MVQWKETYLIIEGGKLKFVKGIYGCLVIVREFCDGYEAISGHLVVMQQWSTKRYVCNYGLKLMFLCMNYMVDCVWTLGLYEYIRLGVYWDATAH